MRWVVRWGAVVVLSLVVFAVVWWACQGPGGLNEGAALGIAGAVLAVFVPVAAFWATRERQDAGDAGRSGRPPTGCLTSPKEGARVGREERVTGVVRDLPPGWHPWIVVYPVNEDVYWPQREFKVEGDGSFRARALFGRIGPVDAGAVFHVRLVLADAADSGQFRAFLRVPHQGRRDLPRGVLTPDERTVVRR
jgi:hypothetical protein